MIDGLKMIFDSDAGFTTLYANMHYGVAIGGWLLAWTLGNMCSIAVFNFVGKKEGGAPAAPSSSPAYGTQGSNSVKSLEILIGQRISQKGNANKLYSALQNIGSLLLHLA